MSTVPAADGPPESGEADTGRRRAGVLAVLAGAQLVLQLDFSIVNVALPRIQSELGFSGVGLQWIVTGYAVTYGSLLLLGGRIGDAVGRRRLFLWGLALFALTSLTSGISQAPWMLVVSRVVQGASGALVAPSALAQLTTMFREGAARNRALGIWQAAAAGGASAGVVAGGLLTEYWSWRGIFLVNLPIVAILVAGALIVLPADQQRGGERPDTGPALFVTAAVAALIFALSHGEESGFADPLTIVALVGFVVLGVVFVLLDRRSSNPMVRPSLVTDPARRLAFLTMLSLGGVVAGYVYFISLYLQQTVGFSAVQTGLALVPATLTVMIMSTFGSRRLLTRVTPRTVLPIGVLVIAAGQLWLSRIGVPGDYPVGVLPGLLLTSIGMGLTFPSASILATSRVAQRDQGVAGGLLTTSQQVGSAVGVAVLATVAAARSSAPGGDLVAGYRLSYLVAAGIAVVVGAAAVVSRARARHQPES